MAINKNHEFEDLDGVKCAVVERKVSPQRVAFLKDLLTFNGFEVVVVPTLVAKAAATAVPKEGEEAPPSPPAPPETFTVGVTDVSFNATNAVFGRLLKTNSGHVVTLAYWQQKEKVSQDEKPYYEHE